jgi:hypothetical protein
VTLLFPLPLLGPRQEPETAAGSSEAIQIEAAGGCRVGEGKTVSEEDGRGQRLDNGICFSGPGLTSIQRQCSSESVALLATRRPLNVRIRPIHSALKQ